MKQAVEVHTLSELGTGSGEYRIPGPGRAGFPRTTDELSEWLGDEGDCHEYLAELRWPTAFSCPACAAPARAHERPRYCPHCGASCCATAGTPLSDLPLSAALLALWELFGHESGANPASVARRLGRSREAAWRFLEGLRGSLVRHDEDRLVGQVHVGQIELTVDESDVAGRPALRRATVLVASEVRGDDVTRVRLGAVVGCAPSSRLDFVRRAVAPAALIRTVRSPVFDGLRSLGFGHHVSGGVGELPPGVERVASLLSLWLYGTEGITVERLGYYLDELSFRYNHRREARPDERQGYLFFSLLRRLLDATDPPR